MTDLNLRRELIPTGMKNRSGRGLEASFITLHNTSNSGRGADAAAHSRMVTRKGYYEWKGKKRWVSWHFTVDDKEVVQQLPINERAIHAGPANGQSLAIEICMHEGIDQAVANDRAAMLVAALLHQEDLDLTALKTHRDWTRKDCPELLLGEWDDFKNSVDRHFGQLADQFVSDLELGGDLLSESFEVDVAEDEIPDDDIDHVGVQRSLEDFLTEEGA